MTPTAVPPAPARDHPPAPAPVPGSRMTRARRLRRAGGSTSGRIVERPRLVASLVARPWPLAVLTAPAGYGKSTLLAQWRAQDPRPFATVSLSKRHDDPARLAAAIGAALSELVPQPVGLSGSAATLEDLAPMLACLGASVLALDGVEALDSDTARATVAQLATLVPPGATLALASRREPPLPLGRLRAQGDIVELRSCRLAMTPAESAELLRRAGLTLTERQAGRLFGLTLGWPAALRLAVRAIHEADGLGAALAAFGGEDSTVREYLAEEVMAALHPHVRTFLRGASVADRLAGPVCDAMLDRRGCATTLRDLARADVPLLPLDREDAEYRLHPLLRQALRAELRGTEPELERTLHRRLSTWYEQEGDIELAIEHAVEARDRELAGRLLTDRCAMLAGTGRQALLDGWLGRLGDEAAAAHPSLALANAMRHLAHGWSDASERWAAMASGGTATAPIAASAGLVRAWRGGDGTQRMVCDGQAALSATPPQNGHWRSLAGLVAGTGHLLAGASDAAEPLLDEGARCGIFDAPLIRSLCLAELAFLALGREDLGSAVPLAARARNGVKRRSGVDYPLAALTFAISALVQARHGRVDGARDDLAHASRRLARLPDVAPWYGALTRVVLARVELKLSHADAARGLLSEAAGLRRRAPGAVALEAWIDETWGLADDYAAGSACRSNLTLAELRVLRLLPSHLTLREIAARLHVSANTVKTQAHAVYRKLDACSRSEAVAHAGAIGLVDT
jgi:LuxR family transcriptional regulator, maltose regulon positive regulatory protein